jgi:ketosteroid isomerase-like protein
MISRRKIQAFLDVISEERIDTDAMVKEWADDVVWDSPSDVGVGQTIAGKAAIVEWYERWEQEFPKRKLVAKSVCVSGMGLLNRTLVIMCNWTCTETDKQGREYVFDGASVIHSRNMKIVRMTDYISFAGLPEVSTLLRPTVSS